MRPAHRARLGPVGACTSPVVQAAAQRWIEVLGEAATHVSAELRERYPDVPGRNIIGTRTILAHAYFHVDQDVVGNIVSTHVPELRRRLRAILVDLEAMINRST